MPNKIKLQLRDLVKSDKACLALGLNPYCVNEGVDGEEFIEVNFLDAKQWGVI